MPDSSYFSGKTLRIGTRKSPLALKQAEMVQALLQAALPGAVVELAPMLTTGDLRVDRSLSEIGGKGLFTKELDEALTSGAIDLAVHSLKDMETNSKQDSILLATLPRADVRDALIAPKAKTLAALPNGAKVGTSSLRRTAILKMLRPDLEIVPLRGNVQTRLDKLARGEADATLLAVAGLTRLGLEHVITEHLPSEDFIPAVGQGAIAIECRRADAKLREILSTLNHLPTWYATVAERSLLERLDGSCRTPIAAYAQVKDDTLSMIALVAKPDGSMHVKESMVGTVADAERIGVSLAEALLAKGGGACLS